MAYNKLELAVLKIVSKIDERNISMVIDTSASMYKNFKYIKDICVLFLKQFSKRTNSSFNLISFSKLCSSFSDGLVSTNSKDTLILASAWIHALQCDSSTNTLSAIVTAFDDNADALLLFTDGLSSQKPTVFVRCIMEVAQGRPVHIVYVNFDHVDMDGIKILQMLASNTGGTFQVVTNADLDTDYSINEYMLSNSYPLLRHTPKVTPSVDHIIERFSEISADDSTNLLGRTILAKRSKDGSYYKGVVVKQPANEPFLSVLFQTEESGLSFQEEELCHAAETIVYDPTRANAICVGDFVLARFDLKGKYSPAQVKATRYVYDNGSPSFTQVYDVELPNKERKQIPKSCAIPITSSHYVNISKDLAERSPCCCHRNEETHCCHMPNNRTLSPTVNATEIAGDYYTHDLKTKIGNQVRESKLLMERLNSRNLSDPPEQHIHQVRSFNLPRQSSSENTRKVVTITDNYDSGFTDDDNNYMMENNSRMRGGFSSKSDTSDSTRPLIYPSDPKLPIASHPIDTASVQSSTSDFSSQQYYEKPYVPANELTFNPPESNQHVRSASDEPRHLDKEPHPPPDSWNKSSKRSNSKRASRRRFRSKSVGRNVVERSRKHWVGRPTWREVKPPRREPGTYSKCKRFDQPDRDEYQSADGVPFPMREEERQKCENWFPGAKPCSSYRYHDIVAHRVVDHSCKRNHPTPPSEEKRSSPTARKYKAVRKPAQKSCQTETERNDKNLEEREIFNEKIGNGNAKIRITVHNNKDQKSIDTQTHIDQYITHREDENPLNKRTQTENFHVKRDMLTKKRLEKEIDNHQVKLDRLKDLRKQTDARILRTKEMDKIR